MRTCSCDLFGVVGKDEDVVQVYDDVDVAQVLEDIVHECLESSGAVRHPEGHDEVFVRAVTGPESRLPFVSFSDADVVCIRLGDRFWCRCWRSEGDQEGRRRGG